MHFSSPLFSNCTAILQCSSYTTCTMYFIMGKNNFMQVVKLKRPFHDYYDHAAYISFCNLILKLCIYVRFSELQINYHDYKNHLMAYVSLIVGKQGHISQVYISFLSLQIIYCILQAMVIHVFQFIYTDVS